MGEDSHYNALIIIIIITTSADFLFTTMSTLFIGLLYFHLKNFIKHSDKVKDIEHVYIRATLVLNYIKLSF